MPKVSVINKNRNRKPLSEKEYQRAFESALRKFKKAVDNAGVIQEVRKREYYEKPAAARVRLKKAAKARWRKKLQQSNARRY